MSLIEHLEGPGWKDFLARTFTLTLDLMEGDVHRWAGSSADDLRAWLRSGGLAQARRRLDEQAGLRGFSNERRAEMAAAFDELVARHRPRLVRLTVRGVLAAPKGDSPPKIDLPRGADPEDSLARVAAGERPLDAWMRERVDAAPDERHRGAAHQPQELRRPEVLLHLARPAVGRATPRQELSGRTRNLRDFAEEASENIFEAMPQELVAVFQESSPARTWRSSCSTSSSKGAAVFSPGCWSVQCPSSTCATFGAHRISTNHASRPASRCTCASTFAIAARVSEIPLAYVVVTSCTMGAAPFQVMV
jgi:hypothetical protein